MIDFDESFKKMAFEQAFTDKSDELLEKISDAKHRYKDGEEIGSGGMKKIVSSFDSFTDRELARAYPLSDETKVDNFISEVRISAKLEHPNIIPLYDIGVEEGQIFFTMKKLSGHNLYELIKKSNRTLSLNDKLEIFLKVCDALSFAHSKNILHLDIKPSNIQVDDFGQVLVCDWGLARDLSDNDTISEDLSTQEMSPKVLNLSYNNKIKGTPGYMAPEQISRRFGSRSQGTDVFSLGALLYFLLTEKEPFSGSNVDILLKQTINGDFIAPIKRATKSHISSALNAVVMKAMRNKRSERYASVKKLSDDIRSYLQGFATSAEEAGFLKEVKLLIIRNKVPFVLSISALIITMLLTTFFIHKLQDEKQIAQAAQAHAEAMALKSLESENVALSAQRETEASRLKALELIEDLQTEKQFSSELKIKAADELMTKAFINFRKNKNYLNATATVRMVLQLNPSHQEALYHAALMEMGAFQMHNTLAYLKQYKGSNDVKWIRDNCLKFVDASGRLKKYTWKETLALTQELLYSGYDPDKTYVAWHINSSIAQKFSIETSIKYARESMSKRNQGQSFKLDAAKLEDDTYKVSLAGSRCAPYEEIRHWPISDLNMSWTNFRNLSILWGSPLKKLNISFTPVNHLNEIWDLNIEELNIRGTKIGNYEAVYKYPLRNLIINEFCSSLHRLNDIKTLKELSLPRGVYSQDKISKLNKNIKITYYNHGS